MTDQRSHKAERVCGTQRPVCGTCGGDDIARDAWACWDSSLQCWTLGAVFDDVTCQTCERSTQIEWNKSGSSS